MHWPLQQDRQFMVTIGYTSIVIGAIAALAPPLLNLIAPEEIVPEPVSISVAGGFFVLVGINLLWLGLGRQPKSAFIRRTRAFLFSYLLRLRNISLDRKSKAIVKWIRVVQALIVMGTLAVVIPHENSELASVIVLILLGLFLLLVSLSVALYVQKQRIARHNLDD